MEFFNCNVNCLYGATTSLLTLQQNCVNLSSNNILELSIPRINMAAKVGNFPSGKVFLQMLSCGIEDAAPSLFLFTDTKR